MPWVLIILVMIIIVGLCFTGNGGDHSPENNIHHKTQNTLWGNKPMIVQLSCHTIRSTTAQTFENAENAEISQGWYVALKSTKTIKFNYSIFSIRHFTTSTSSIGTSCPLIFHISLVSEPHLDVYIQLEYLARSAYYIACWQGSWDCSFAVYGLIMVYVFLFFLRSLPVTIRLS